MSKSEIRRLLADNSPTSMVVVVKDARVAPRHPELSDGYKAALINFEYIANAVLSTDEVVATMG
ncbi:MAG: hypothetical protein V7K40_33185 [Nostoc sp.]|uniref:hypothetical protein n=1 Tax=Nostoc sp. TaxID=1180 RepID=UPI002FF7CF87